MTESAGLEPFGFFIEIDRRKLFLAPQEVCLPSSGSLGKGLGRYPEILLGRKSAGLAFSELQD